MLQIIPYFLQMSGNEDDKIGVVEGYIKFRAVEPVAGKQVVG
jgi:hypothetical protein